MSRCWFCKSVDVYSLWRVCADVCLFCLALISSRLVCQRWWCLPVLSTPSRLLSLSVSSELRPMLCLRSLVRHWTLLLVAAAVNSTQLVISTHTYTQHTRCPAAVSLWTLPTIPQRLQQCSFYWPCTPLDVVRSSCVNYWEIVHCGLTL